MHTTDLAPWSKQYWIDGKVDSILFGSVISYYPEAACFKGTLKSALRRTLFPANMCLGILSIVNLRDNIAIDDDGFILK